MVQSSKCKNILATESKAKIVDNIERDHVIKCKIIPK